jgi:hypothetical protein
MLRSRRAVQVLLLTGIIASGAFAAAIPYNINFTTDSGSPTPTSGSFTYDGGAAIGSQFTAFDVEWDGLPFDLTTSPIWEVLESGAAPQTAPRSSQFYRAPANVQAPTRLRGGAATGPWTPRSFFGL